MEIDELYKIFESSKGVSTDTRDDLEGKIFFALSGERFNGNEFARQALDKGAVAAVVDQEEMAEGEGLFFVNDALLALQELAAYHRKTLTNTVILAIGGSNGKTTTKELTAAVLSVKFKTIATKGNLNNHIGVPLTILGIRHDHEMAVVELGCNHMFETARLCRIADPDFGLITNIGKDHLEGFGSVERCAAANGELFQHLKENKGLAFINTLQPLVVKEAELLTRKVTYPQADDFFHAKGSLVDGLLVIETRSGKQVHTNLTGLYNLDNVAAALCVGKYFDVDMQEAFKAVSAYEPKNNRSQRVKTVHNTLIMDAYNANPSSMDAALDSFGTLEAAGHRKAVILGDMNELGSYSQEEHEALGRKLHTMHLDKVLLCGKEMAHTAENCPEAQYFHATDELRNYLETQPLRGFTILLKASRSSRLENLAPLL